VPRGPTRPRLPAQLVGTEVGDRLPHVELVLPTEPVEQATRVVRADWEQTLPAKLTGQDRRHRSGGLVRHCGRVPVPGRVLGQSSEVWPALHIDLSLSVDEGGRRQLVEDHDHQRRGPRDGSPFDVRTTAGPCQLRGRREAEKPHQQQNWNRRQNAQDGRDEPATVISEREPRSGRHGKSQLEDRHQDALQHLKRERRDQQTDEREV
jgi:hypothetical protein